MSRIIHTFLIILYTVNDVMVLAGHPNFATTNKIYLAVANNLVDRTRRASAPSFSQNLLQQ
jgi:hypothetical protein